jgi:ferredoxin
MEDRPAAASVTNPRLAVRVDQNKCCGFGFCWEIAAEIFQIADSGIAYTTTELVPEHLVTAVRQAEERCPQEAVLVWEENDSRK